MEMGRLFNTILLLPAVMVFWAWALGSLGLPPEAKWALPYLTLLTLLALLFRARSPYPGVLTLVILAWWFVQDSTRCHCGRGHLTCCKSNLKNTATALEMYAADNQGAYPGELAQLTPNYVKILPNCPSAQEDTYSITYVGRGEHFTLYCSGAHHLASNTPAGYPKYSDREGLIER